MPEETPTPATLTAVQCGQCTKLIPADEQYIHAVNVVVNEVCNKDATAWDRNRAMKLRINNIVFCTVSCLCERIRASNRGDER